MGRSTPPRWIALAIAVALVAIGCSNAEKKSSGDDSTTTTEGESTGTVAPGSFPAVSAPGVSATEIRVGGVASVNNPLGGSYGAAFDGAHAYFDMVNSQGGVYGRQLVLAEKRDDGAVNNKTEVDGLIAEDIFAVIPVATLLFNGADALAKSGIPTFGWTINPEWAGTPSDPRSNLFGQTGSYLGFTDPKPNLPYVVGKLKKRKLGVLAYNVPQSADCAEGVRNSIEKYGDAVDAEIAYFDKTLSWTS